MQARVFRGAVIAACIATIVWLVGVLPILIFDHTFVGTEIILLISHATYPLVAGISLWLARRYKNNLWLVIMAPETAWLFFVAGFIVYAIATS